MPRLATAALISLVVLWLGPLSLARQPVAAPDAPAQGPRLEFVSQVGGGSLALAVTPQRVYLGTGPTVQVLDTAPLGRPNVLGRTAPLADVVRDLALAPGHLVAAAGADGLAVYDLALPDRPGLVGREPGAPASAVAMSGTLAAVTTAGAGLRLVDLTMPAQPRVTGQLTTTRFLGGLVPAAGGFYALVASDPVSPTGGIAYVRVLAGAPSVAATFGPTGHGLASSGARLAVTTSEGLELYDTTSPSTPQLLGTWHGPPAFAVALDGNLAAVADAAGSVVLIDIADPAAPQMRGRVNETTPAAALRFAGTRLLLALAGGLPAGGSALDDAFALSGGLAAFDAANPANPVRWSTFEAPSGRLTDVSVAYRTALLTDNGGGAGHTWRVELADPAAPAVDGVAATTGQPYHVAARPGFGIVTSEREFMVVDTSAPHSLRPALRTPAIVLGRADIALDNTLLYAVGTDVGGLAVVDMSNRLAPRRWPLEAEPDLSDAAAVAVGHGRLFAAGESGLRVLDVRVPTFPRTLAYIPEVGPDRGVAGMGSAGYAAHRLDGLRTVDAARVLEIRAAGSLPGAPLVAVAQAQDRVFTLDESMRLAVVDVSDIGHPRELASLDAPPVARAAGVPVPVRSGALATTDDVVLVAHPERGLLIYRAVGTGLEPTATPPPAPTGRTVYLPFVSRRGEVEHLEHQIDVVGRYDPLNTEPHGLALSGGAAFVSTSSGQENWITTLDVSQPGNVVEIGRLPDLAQPAVQLLPNGTQLVAALGEGGAALFDATDPRALRLLGRAIADHSIARVAVAEKLLYALDQSRSGNTTLRVFNVADPSAPIEVGRLEVATDLATDIEVHEHRAYLSLPSGAGLRIVDVSDPAAPVVERDVPVLGLNDALMSGAALVGINQGNPALGGLPGGLWVLDPTSDPPREIGSLVSIDWPEVQGGRHVSLSDTLALITNDDSMRVLDISLPSWPRLVATREGGYTQIQDAVLVGRRISLTDTSAGVVLLDVVEAAP